MILAIDPGSSYSAFVIFDPDKFDIHNGHCAKLENDMLLKALELYAGPGSDMTILCEYPAPRGQMMTWQLVDTIFWIGRLFQYCTETLKIDPARFIKIDRKDVKLSLCSGIKSPKDAHVRMAIMNMFGGESSISKGKCKECKGRGYIGKKSDGQKCSLCDEGKVPVGQLSMVTSDIWQALGVAIYYTNEINKSKDG